MSSLGHLFGLRETPPPTLHTPEFSLQSPLPLSPCCFVRQVYAGVSEQQMVTTVLGGECQGQRCSRGRRRCLLINRRR